MILARPLTPEAASELQLAFQRLGLPRSAREYLDDKVSPLQLVLTGLTRREGSFLKDRFASCVSPGHEDFPLYVAGDQEPRPGSGLLMGRRDQFELLVRSARASGLDELAGALGAALQARTPPSPLRLRGREYAFGERPYVMGVVNVTPDSFSDGGRFVEPAAAIRHGMELVEAGAELIDVGGESTRPGAARLVVEEELQRVLPVIIGLRARTEVPISVDTTKARVAHEALQAGADLVNDVSGFRFDPELAGVVAKAQAACCLMHLQGTPQTMQLAPRYDDLMAEVIEQLEQSVRLATAAGVRRDQILIDPGIGFGKTVGHNLYLLRHLHQLRVLGLPILVGTSRKSFLGRLLGDRPVEGRLFASVASVAAMALSGGADVVRVHDVAQAKDAVTIASAIRQAADGGDLSLPRSSTPSG